MADRGLLVHVGPDPPVPKANAPQIVGRSLSDKQPSHSFLRLTYPFSSIPELRQLYSRGPDLDVAHWLEDLDLFAADVAGRHVDIHKGDKKLVTALLEQLVWLGGHWGGPLGQTPLAAAGPHGSALLQHHDVLLSGQVTWVGRSSLEVNLELWAHPADASSAMGVSELHASEREVTTASVRALQGQLPNSNLDTASCQKTSASGHANGAAMLGGDGAQPDDRAGCVRSPAGARGGTTLEGSEPAPAAVILAVARVIMAARSLDLTRSAQVPGLKIQDGVEAARFKLGEAGHRARLARRDREKLHAPPDAAELKLLAALTPRSLPGKLHSLDAGQLDAGEHRSYSEATAAAPVSMASTRLHQVVVTTERDVNTTGSTFGGHLLRLGYEHAVRVAAAHAGGTCTLISAYEVAFLALVPIGADLHLDGCVAFVEGDCLHVHVTAYLKDGLEDGTDATRGRGTAQTFWFVFQSSGAAADSSASTSDGVVEICRPQQKTEASGRNGLHQAAIRTLPSVFPELADEMDVFLHALRKHKADFE